MLHLLERALNWIGSLICVIPLALPACGVQLLLLRFCKSLFIQLIPAALGGVLFLLSSWTLATRRGFEALMALLLMIPAVLLLLGSALGWLIWHSLA